MKTFTTKLLLIAAFAAMTLVGCNNDDKPVKQTPFEVNMNLPANATNAVITKAEVTMVNVNTGKVTTFTQENVNSLKFTVDEGIYNIKVNGTIKYTLDGTEVSGTVQAVRDNYTVTPGATESETPKCSVELFFHNSQSGFVIEEIFFTGTVTEEGKQYTGDKYFRITNNSDETLYADSLAIVESAFLTVTKYDYTPDIMSQAMAVKAVYAIPGNGKQHPVEPGKSLIICDNAINHKDANPLSFDLSGADFEWYDISTVASVQDIDNPEVPNLDKYYSNTASIWGPHNRGFASYAIARMGVDKETYLKDYTYKASYEMVLASGTYPMSQNYYKIPNSWIVDAVNLSVESKFAWIVTDPSLDMGWTYCGKIDMDATRYGKSVRRKVLANGKLKDTNNSTEDFDPEVTPSMMK